MKKLLLLTIFCLTFVMLTACGISNSDYEAVISERDDANSKIDDLTKEVATLKEENEKLKKENEEYAAIIEPYKELSEAELLAKTNEANLKAEEDAKALEELEKKEAEEKAAKEKKEKEAKEKEEKMGYETGITFDQLARTPDDYLGKKVKFTGKVIQVIEGDSAVQLRFNIDSDYDKTIYLEYDKSIVSSRILEDDIITIYGVSNGLLSYQSTLGATITIPSVLVDKIDQ